MSYEETVREVFKKNLTRLLTEKQTTQKALADYMGVSTATISDWKKGKIIPRMDKVDKLCTYFHISRSELLGSPSDTKHDAIYPPPASDNFTHQEHDMIYAYRNAPASVKHVIETILQPYRKNNEALSITEISIISTMADSYAKAGMNYPDALNRAMKEFANMLSGNVDVSAKQKA
jgi:transcriptional regulator with XRE-family HTH domain